LILGCSEISRQTQCGHFYKTRWPLNAPPVLCPAQIDVLPELTPKPLGRKSDGVSANDVGIEAGFEHFKLSDGLLDGL
jgi:hypothetical protein